MTLKLTETERKVLQYLFYEQRARQKRDIAPAIDSTVYYMNAVLPEMRNKGLLEVSTHRGWWSLTDKGRDYAQDKEVEEPFFSIKEVNNNRLLRAISNKPMEVQQVVQQLTDEVLEFLVALYLLKKNKPIPQGKPLQDQELPYVNKLAGDLIENILAAQSLNLVEVK